MSDALVEAGHAAMAQFNPPVYDDGWDDWDDGDYADVARAVLDSLGIEWDGATYQWGVRLDEWLVSYYSSYERAVAEKARHGDDSEVVLVRRPKLVVRCQQVEDKDVTS